MLFFVRSTCGSGKISLAQKCQVSQRRNNIVLGGEGLHVWCKDEEVERTIVFHRIFVSVPRTVGDCCTLHTILVYKKVKIVHCSTSVGKSGYFYAKSLNWCKP